MKILMRTGKNCVSRVVLFSLLMWPFLSGQTESSNWQLKDKSKTINQAYLANYERSLEPDFFCTNNNALRVSNWQDPNFVRAVNQFGSQKIRFPGGTVSNYWDWRSGGLIEAFRKWEDDFFHSFSKKDRNYSASKLEDFQQGLRLTDTEPVFVLNMSTSDLESQLEMLREAENLGLPIKHIELGNELYIGFPNYRDAFPEPEDYANEAKEWISAIKAEFPEAKIGVVGVLAKPDKPPRYKQWNKSLMPETLNEADAIILHFYGNHGLDQEETQFPTYPFFTVDDTKTILGQPFAKWQGIQNSPQFKLLPDDRNIWITEYNLYEDIFYGNKGAKPKVMGSWAHGLFALTMSLLYLEEPRVEFICNHQLLNNFRFGSILPRANSFVDPATQLPIAEPYSLTATGTALSMFGKAINNMDRAVAIAFNNSKTATINNKFEYPTLYGWMFSNREEQNSLMMNLSNQAETVEVSSLFDRQASYETIFGSPRDLVAKPDVLQRKTGRVYQTITLPPYSVTRISSFAVDNLNDDLQNKLETRN